MYACMHLCTFELKLNRVNVELMVHMSLYAPTNLLSYDDIVMKVDSQWSAKYVLSLYVNSQVI